jgi:hypothetical protein
MMKAVHAVLGLCALASLAVPAAAQKQGIHEDTKKGFRIKVPEKWTTIPVKIDEKWIVAKFLSNRSYETKARDVMEAGQHKPLIQVIEFDDEARKLKVAEEKRGDTTYLAKNAPYRDYKDYLKRNVGEGWYIDKEEPTTEAGVPCTKFQVRIEKGALMKRRLITWLFRGEKGELAVECDVLEDHFEKLEPQMLAALKSFKLIPRTTVEATAAITGENGADNMWVTDRRKWKELPVEERQRRRKRIEEERLAKSQKDLLPGWTAKRTKHYLVLSHADAKYTKTVIEAVESYRTWLEENYDVLTDEYVMHGVIRICADLDEARTYARSSNNQDSFNPDNREVVTYQDKSEGNAGVDWSRLFMGMFDQYIYDKDSLLYNYLPLWIHRGLHGYVGSAKIKSGKLVNEPEDEENNRIREVERAGAFAALKDLMGDKLEGEIKTSTDADRLAYNQWLAQTNRLVRYIIGQGAKNPKLKDFVLNYMKGTMAIAEGMDAERRQSRATATTEEEEKANNDEDKNYWKRRRSEILERLNKDLGWDDATWTSIQKAFHDYLKK